VKLSLVTDRRRLASAIGARPGELDDVLVEQVQAAARAGVDYVQVREPDLEARELASLVKSLLGAIQGSGALLVVNDRLDVALAAGASGVHLKEAGIAPEIARRLTPPGFIIGCSVHSPALVRARKAADYLIAGTVLPTGSKRAPDYLNEEGLRRIVEAAAGQPVFGIGGLDVRSIPLLATSGATGMAAVGAFIPASGETVRAHLSEFVQKRVKELRFALDHVTHRT
jgi:thiamine-phosphate pyrophosphorylase